MAVAKKVFQRKASTGLNTTPTSTDEPALQNTPLTFHQLLTPRVTAAVSNYLALAFFDTILFMLLPVYYATPITSGGLGLDPFHMGAIFSIFGIWNGTIQPFLIPFLVKRLGTRNLFMCGMSSFVPTFAMFPLISAVAKLHGEVSSSVWGLLIVQYIFITIRSTCFCAYKAT
jgi:hypothetical protein